MPLLPELGMFALLPEPKSRWREFVFGYGTESAALIILLSLGILRPQILTRSTGSYRPIALVNTPVPVNHEPAPVRVIQAPRLVAQRPMQVSTNLRLEPRLSKTPEEPAPRVQAREMAVPTNSPPAVPHLRPLLPLRRRCRLADLEIPMACLQRRPTGSRSQSRRLDHLIYRLEAVPATEPAEQRARRESSKVSDSAME